MYESICAYAFFEEEPKFDDMILDILWENIKPQLDACRKRWQNSLKGGCPKGIKKPQMIGNQNATKENKTKTKPKQNHSKTKTNPNININNNNKNIKENKEIELSTKVANSLSTEADTDYVIEYKGLISFWNDTVSSCVNIPQIRTIEGQRKSHVNARCKQFGKKAIVSVIEKVAESDFLDGNNSNGFHATFDWVFAPNNFVKILEGNYKNRQTNGTDKNDSKSEFRRNMEQEILNDLKEGGYIG